MDIEDKTIEVFCCYARKDQSSLLKLKSHLTPLERAGLITLWSDTSIDAGMDWKKEINQHLKTAQIILLLVSPDFMESDYCYSIEMKQAMERHEREEAQVIPVILRPVYWQESLFGKLQALPVDAVPIQSSRWSISDEAFLDVVEGIRKTANQIRTKVSFSRKPFLEQVERKNIQEENKSDLGDQDTQGDSQQNIQQRTLPSSHPAISLQRDRDKISVSHWFGRLRHAYCPLWTFLVYISLSLFVIALLLAQIVIVRMIPPGTGASSLVYHDSLNNANNMDTEREEWERDDHCFFASDGYHIDSSIAMSCIEQGVRYQDSSISVNMIVLSPNPAGLVFRNQGYDGGYYFEVSPDPCTQEIVGGTRGCYHLAILGSSELQQWTPSPAIHTQGQNFLRVIAMGDRLMFFINEQYLTTIVDAHFLSGLVGFACFIPTGHPCKAVFNNLTVDDLSKETS